MFDPKKLEHFPAEICQRCFFRPCEPRSMVIKVGFSAESAGGKLDGAIITLQYMSEIRNLAGAMDVGCNCKGEYFFEGNMETSACLRVFIYT